MNIEQTRQSAIQLVMPRLFRIIINLQLNKK